MNTRADPRCYGRRDDPDKRPRAGVTSIGGTRLWTLKSPRRLRFSLVNHWGQQSVPDRETIGIAWPDWLVRQNLNLPEVLRPEPPGVAIFALDFRPQVSAKLSVLPSRHRMGMITLRHRQTVWAAVAIW